MSCYDLSPSSTWAQAAAWQAEVVAIVDAFKDHPALLAWCAHAQGAANYEPKKSFRNSASFTGSKRNRRDRSELTES